MKKINYVLDENNIIVSWTRVPFDDNKPYIELADSIEIHEGCDKVVDGEFIVDNAAFVAKQEAKRIAETKLNRVMELKHLLAESDYLCLKHADGDLTDEEYEVVKAQRHAWRVEINELEA